MNLLDLVYVGLCDLGLELNLFRWVMGNRLELVDKISNHPRRIFYLMSPKHVKQIGSPPDSLWYFRVKEGWLLMVKNNYLFFYECRNGVWNSRAHFDPLDPEFFEKLVRHLRSSELVNEF